MPPPAAHMLLLKCTCTYVYLQCTCIYMHYVYIYSTMSLHDSLRCYIHVPGKKVSRPLGVSLRGGAQFLSGNTKMFLEVKMNYIYMYTNTSSTCTLLYSIHVCIYIYIYIQVHSVP